MPEWLKHSPQTLKVPGLRQFLHETVQNFFGYPVGNGYLAQVAIC